MSATERPPKLRSRGRGHEPEVRARSVALSRQVGNAQAAQELGLRAGTVSAWRRFADQGRLRPDGTYAHHPRHRSSTSKVEFEDRVALVPSRPPAKRYIGPGRVSYDEYLATRHWAKCRRLALGRAGHRCQVCAHVDRLQVHHNSYDRIGEEKPEDLFVLCGQDHAIFHEMGRAPKGPEFVWLTRRLEVS